MTDLVEQPHDLNLSVLDRLVQLCEASQQSFQCTLIDGQPQRSFILRTLRLLRTVHLEANRLTAAAAAEARGAGVTWQQLADAAGDEVRGAAMKRWRDAEVSGQGPTLRHPEDRLDEIDIEWLLRTQRQEVAGAPSGEKRSAEEMQPLVDAARVARTHLATSMPLGELGTGTALALVRTLHGIEALAKELSLPAGSYARAARLTWQHIGNAAGTNAGAAYKRFTPVQESPAAGVSAPAASSDGPLL